jgi:hypothetical protein
MDSMEKFRELAGPSASEGIVFARVAEPFVFKGSRVIAWDQSLDAY